MDWKAKSAAICLAPALRRAVLVAVEKDQQAPAFEDCPYDDRQAWVEISEDVVATVIRLISPVAPADDSLFQATAELTRRHFAAIRGGKS
jgi:hypothetical protein